MFSDNRNLKIMSEFLIEDYSKYPRHLFQYLRFDINFIENLINHHLWFSDFHHFNDPFDSQIVLDTSFTFDEILEYLNYINEKNTLFLKTLENPLDQISFLKYYSRNNLSDEEIYRTINQVYNKNEKIRTIAQLKQRANYLLSKPKETKDLMDCTVSEELANYRILCLTKDKTSNIMWSHYSNKHSGVCIKLDTHEDFPFFSFPLKVKYTAKYPKYNYISYNGKYGTASMIFRTKYLYWKYEKEVRILKDKRNTKFKNEGLLEYNKKVLVEINFGLKSSTNDIETVKKINQKYYDNKVIINKAYKTDFSFNLKFNRIK